MEYEKIVQEIENLASKNKTTFIHGGWGIGKTHLIKKVFLEEYRKKYNILYVDSRIIDLNKDIYELIIDFVSSNLHIEEKVKKIIKKTSKFLINSCISFANNKLPGNIPFINIDNKDNIKNKINKKLKKNNDIWIIIDELDRVTPQTILKTLNYINGLSHLQIENKNLRILVVGNKEELESILLSQFGLKSNKNFLNKYFEREIDIKIIQNKSLIDISKNRKFSKNINWEGLSLVNARMLKRKYRELNDIMEKYGNHFSELVYFAFFVCDIFKMDKNMWTWDSNFFSDKSGKTKLVGKFTFNENDKEKLIRFSNNKFFNEECNPIEDIVKKSSLHEFDDWVLKWFTNIFNTINKKIEK